MSSYKELFFLLITIILFKVEKLILSDIKNMELFC